MKHVPWKDVGKVKRKKMRTVCEEKEKIIPRKRRWVAEGELSRCERV